MGEKFRNVRRSYDRSLLEEVSSRYPEMFPKWLIDEWLNDPANYMFAEDRSVGLFTFEYPGVYTGHWFFTDDHRGRKALELADTILDTMFNQSDAQIIRGLVQTHNKPSRWAARQAGFTSHGIVGDCEIFTLTKEEFYNNRKGI